MNPPDPPINELVMQALEAALQQGSECRLISSGKAQPGLFPGGKLTAAKNKAIEEALDPARNLFTVREVEESKGKSKGIVQFATITNTGITSLLRGRPASVRRELLEKCADPLKEAAQQALVSILGGELQEIERERKQLDGRSSEILEVVGRIVSDYQAALGRARERLDQETKQLNSLLSVDKKPPVSATPREIPDGQQRQIPLPETDAEIDFQRDLCQELVFSWQDHSDGEARAALEQVMLNTGLERVREVGEQVAFDGREHRTEADLLPGQPAIVVAPGWQFVSPRGTLQIAPAQVVPAE